MRATKRVLFVNSGTEPWGAEVSLRNLLGSAPPGWECSLLACSQAVVDVCRPFVNEVHLVPPRRGKLRNLETFFASVWALKEQYDVVVLFNLRLLPIALIAWARQSGIRVVADLHDAPVGLDRALSRFCLRFTAGNIAISRFVVDHLGISHADIVPRPIPEGRTGGVEPPAVDGISPIVLGIIGRVDPEKRIDVAIDAVRDLPARFQLHVYGDPCLAEEGYLQALMNRASPGARTVFRGYLNADEIYAEVDAVIVCNDREPSGRTVGEAMVRSKIVFAPDRGGAQEFFDDSVSGFVYRALDPQSLARAIAFAFGPSSDADLIRRRAREKILHERSPQAVADEYFSVLERAVKT